MYLDYCTVKNVQFLLSQLMLALLSCLCDSMVCVLCNEILMRMLYQLVWTFSS